MAAGYQLHSVGYNNALNGCYYSGVVLPTGSLGSMEKDYRRNSYRMLVHTKGLNVVNVKFTPIKKGNENYHWCTINPPEVLYPMRPITLQKLYYKFPQIEDELNMFILAQMLRDK